jgi:hypothetical protein
VDALPRITEKPGTLPNGKADTREEPTMAYIPDVDHHLHDVLERITREQGPVELDWLTRRARKIRRDARVDEEAVTEIIAVSTLLVWRPDGTIDHLLHVLDGSILTQRARAPLAGRDDLWCTVALQPLLNITGFTSLPLADGSGEVRRAPSGHEVLVGPKGWLPDVPRYGVVALRLQRGGLSVVAVDEAGFPDPAAQEQVRQLLARHCRIERWYDGTDDDVSRPGEMVRALALGVLEDPDLLSEPLPPLDELLYLSLDRDGDLHYWRNRGATVEDTLSFVVQSMPRMLHRELNLRAQRYGMSFDQYVVAVLGHLAWRTPFADDMGPWETWDPDRPEAGVTRLSIAE